MKSLVLLLALLCLAGCSLTRIASSPKVETREYVVRVVSYDIASAVLDAIPPEDTVHLDCLVFDILSPEDMKGKRWHLFIRNEVWREHVDFGYHEGDVLTIDVPKFHSTKQAILGMMKSEEWMSSFWITNDLIKRANQSSPLGEIKRVV
jgi:hypothetical protein